MPHAKLTDNLIKNLKPKRAKYIVRDSQLPGFGVVVNPSGKKNYRVEGHLAVAAPRAAVNVFSFLIAACSLAWPAMELGGDVL